MIDRAGIAGRLALQAIVRAARAVIVNVVTQLLAAGMDVGARVIAVASFEGGGRHRCTALDWDRARITVAVVIDVRIPRKDR
jgi:hypothetical protein